MIIDTGAIMDKRTANAVLSEIKRTVLSNSKEFGKVKIKYNNEHNGVLAYYTNPKVLFTRICEILRVTKVDLLKGKHSEIPKAVTYCVMFSYGHKAREINELFGISKNSAGMQIYYRHKLRDLFVTHPQSITIFQVVMNTLEKDIEVLDDII
jgi:hypothetical protein